MLATTKMNQILFIDLFKSDLHVSGDKLAHPQEHFWLYIQLLVQCTDIAADRWHGGGRTPWSSISNMSPVGSIVMWYMSAHIPLLCVQWKTPGNGQRNCPTHVEFYSKNKFEKLAHLVGYIIRIYTPVLKYTIAVCTVKNSWWWTEEMLETFRVLFQK